MAVATPPAATDLRSAFKALQQTNPKLRIRDAAAELGVSEAELVASECGHSAVRLQPQWCELLHAMPNLGRVMCLTRNDTAVHERYGCFEKVEAKGLMGLVVGPDIDLRLFLRHWKYGFATVQELASGSRHSLQFFNADGTAVFKVYATNDTDMAAWNTLVVDFTAADQDPRITDLGEGAREEPPQDNDNVDVAKLREEWANMRDTHAFIGLLHRHKVDRRAALKYAGEEFARPLPLQAGSAMLGFAATTGQPIMVFVGSQGCVQIHSGPVKSLKRMGPWYNVLDAEFNLHMREDDIREAWLVRKPTEDGDITSIELYNQAGELAVQFFGARKPGIPEREDWRDLIHAVFEQHSWDKRDAA